MTVIVTLFPSQLIPMSLMVSKSGNFCLRLTDPPIDLASLNIKKLDLVI